MRGRLGAPIVTVAVAVATMSLAQAQKRDPVEKPGPPMSGFYDYWNAGSEFGVGIGITDVLTCSIGVLTQPAVYAGNNLVDCDAEVPHNETTITVNPYNPSHAVAGYHSYQISALGATLIAHIIGTTSVTFDGGANWQEVVPPITPFQFSGDPALAFDTNGRVYFANIADHEGPGGNFTAPSVIVAHSDDGGLTWSSPTTVAAGQGAVTAGGGSRVLSFQDKEFIAVDTSPASPYTDRAYVTWTSFQDTPFQSISPIMVARSDNGTSWSQPRRISGSHPACATPFGGSAPGECAHNQFSSPSTAPNGKVYVAFENFNTPAENQYMVVTSSNGGASFGNPVRVDTIFDVNFPISPFSGRSTLTGCQFRIAAPGNIAADPSDPTGNTAYIAWADNRNGTPATSNADVLLARTTDGGQNWTTYVIDNTPNDQFYAWVAVAPNGRVDVGYMDRSYSSGQGVCQYGFSLNRLTFNAGGIATQVKTRVDTGLSDAGRSRWFSSLTGGNATFLGDYNAVAVGSDGATWSLWTDFRNVIPMAPANRNHGQHAVGVRTP